MFLGTPQTEESIYNKLRLRGYDCRIWTSRYPKKPEKYGDALAPMIKGLSATKPGQPTDPDRFSEMDFARKRSKLWSITIYLTVSVRYHVI